MSKYPYKLSVYLVKGLVNSYVEGIEAIEKLQPLEKIKLFNLHIRGGSSPRTTEPSQVNLVRDLGARPAIQVINYGFYSTVRFIKDHACSLVATLRLSEDPEDLMVCILSECDIIAVNVDVNQEQERFEESIPVLGKHAFPWARMKDVLEL